MVTSTNIEAIVQNVVPGKHGLYAVTTSTSIKGSITFSLHKEVWKEDGIPERGNLVILTDVRRKPSGWRAYKACFLRPYSK
jgi:hypothetical protein